MLTRSDTPSGGLIIEPVQLIDQSDAAPGEHPLRGAWCAGEQPRLKDEQVGHEQRVLAQPPVEGRIGDGAVAHRVQKRMPGRGGPQSIGHTGSLATR
jgi:hypothetical protein